jgi:hypothetical protein
MHPSVEQTRTRMLQLLAETCKQTRSALANIDPEKVVFAEDPQWRMRDALGHVGVWNGEAARSIEAHAGGNVYHCVDSESEYDHYNALAVAERRTWTMDQVWAEYDASCDELQRLVETMSAQKWLIDMLYPWNEIGSLQRLIDIMMKHEVEHREAIIRG